jgi:hypothetical protein
MWELLFWIRYEINLLNEIEQSLESEQGPVVQDKKSSLFSFDNKSKTKRHTSISPRRE